MRLIKVNDSPTKNKTWQAGAARVAGAARGSGSDPCLCPQSPVSAPGPGPVACATPRADVSEPAAPLTPELPHQPQPLAHHHPACSLLQEGI